MRGTTSEKTGAQKEIQRYGDYERQREWKTWKPEETEDLFTQRSRNNGVKKTCDYTGFAFLKWTKQPRQNATPAVSLDSIPSLQKQKTCDGRDVWRDSIGV